MSPSVNLDGLLKQGKRRLRSPLPAKKADASTIDDQPKEPLAEDVGFPDGVKVWHDYPDAVIDICFVHGLTGNRDSTWTAHGQDTPWPKRLLPNQLPGARLLTYGYDADIVRASVASTKRLIDHATELLADVTDDRDQAGASNRPVIFVAHSMGGLICKRAMILSRNNPERHLRTLFDSVVGVIFMGTPHRGSWMADWAKIPASALSFVRSTNESLLRVLSPSDQLLESVQADFWSMVRGVREDGKMFEVVCFYEELPLPAVGSVVVSKTSATQEGYPDRGIHANHSDMVKFSSEDQNGYKKVLAALVRMKKQVSSSSPAEANQEPPSMSERTAQTVDPAKNDHSESHYYLPLRRSKAFRFIGRAEKLEELQGKLFDDEDGCQTVALVGLGGVGKTQLALQLVDWVRQNKPDHSVFWIPALSSASFERACKGIIDMIGVQPRPESSKESATEMLRDYLNSELAGRWLLVVDNADDEEILFDSGERHGLLHYLPSSDLGSTLFTTRSQEVATRTCNSAYQGIIQLERMSEAEASQFLGQLLENTSIDVNEDSKHRLIEKLAFHPLAIKQAAAFIYKNTTSLTRYLELIDGTEREEIDLLNENFSDGSRYQESQNAVAATLLVSFNQVQQRDQGAASILAFLSRVEPQGIPEFMIPGAESRIKFERSIGTLRGFAFLDQHEDQDGDIIYDMHRLVHLATKYWVNNDDPSTISESMAIRKMNDVFPTDEWANRNRWRKLMPHALKLILQSEMPVDSTTATLSYRMCECLAKDLNKRGAVLLSRHIASRMPTAPEESHIRLKVQEIACLSLFDSGKMDEAIELLHQEIKECRGVKVELDNDIFNAQMTLASLYRNSFRIPKAIDLLETMIDATGTSAQIDQGLRDDALRSLGHTLIQDEQFERAAPILEELVKNKGQQLEEDDPTRLRLEISLAAAYVGLERYKEASHLLERAQAIDETKRERDGRVSLTAQQILALVYIKIGQPATAVTLIENVITVSKTVYQEDEDSLLTSQRLLARACLQVGRTEESIKISEDVATREKNAKAPTVKKILLSQRQLALGLLEGHVPKQDDRAQRAASILQEAIETKQANCPHHNWELGDLEELLARARQACDAEKEPTETSGE